MLLHNSLYIGKQPHREKSRLKHFSSMCLRFSTLGFQLLDSFLCEQTFKYAISHLQPEEVDSWKGLYHMLLLFQLVLTKPRESQSLMGDLGTSLSLVCRDRVRLRHAETPVLVWGQQQSSRTCRPYPEHLVPSARTWPTQPM